MGSGETKPLIVAQDGARYCDVAEPFRWSRSDTRETQDQAVAQNAVYKALCQKGK